MENRLYMYLQKRNTLGRQNGSFATFSFEFSIQCNANLNDMILIFWYFFQYTSLIPISIFFSTY